MSGGYTNNNNSSSGSSSTDSVTIVIPRRRTLQTSRTKTTSTTTMTRMNEMSKSMKTFFVTIVTMTLLCWCSGGCCWSSSSSSYAISSSFIGSVVDAFQPVRVATIRTNRNNALTPPPTLLSSDTSIIIGRKRKKIGTTPSLSSPTTTTAAAAAAAANHNRNNRKTDGIGIGSMRRRSSSRLYGLFDGLFGDSSSSSSSSYIRSTEKDAILAEFVIVADGNDDVQYASLVDYITNEWAALFDNGTIKLTTPVQVERHRHGLGRTATATTQDTNAADDIDTASCVEDVKFIFYKSKSNYQQWNDKDHDGDDDDNNSNGRDYKGGGTSGSEDSNKNKNSNDDKDVVREGAVIVQVERLSSSSSSPSLRVRAIRSDIDDGTIIKEMSEERIVQELQEAITVWKKKQKEQM